MKTIKKLSMLLLATLVLWSCSNDDDGATPINPPPAATLNIVETAQATADLSILVDAVIQANLTTTLSGTGPYTVLAPTNAAFQEFLDSNPAWNSLADIDNATLTQVLLNHVISGTVTSTALISNGSGYTSTLADGAGGQNLSIYYNTTAGVKFNDLATVTTADVLASNGVVHIVDKVITLPSIVDHAIANPELSSLVAAVTRADQTTVLAALTGATAADPLTVLAPVDAAFTTFLDGTPLANVPAADLTQLLLNHTMNGFIDSTTLTTAVEGYANTNATGAGGNAMSIYYNTATGVTFNGVSTVAIADIVGTNGIVHAVDAVVDLPTIATFATANPALSSLVAALQLADTGTPTVPYITTVSDATAGPFTVFAPTNDAFAALLLELDPTGNTALGDVAPATVDEILTYHIVSANVQSSMLVSGPVTTLGGDITVDATAFTLTDPTNTVSNIITTLVDIQATNGVVHAIDTVLQPL
jgi:uncharacterized surface protein with fasciclin (FAS1) repeats